jgi:hypothetical protein
MSDILARKNPPSEITQGTNKADQAVREGGLCITSHDLNPRLVLITAGGLDFGNQCCKVRSIVACCRSLPNFLPLL